MEKIAKVIAGEVVEMAVKIAATTNVIPALARALVSMRRARPRPTTISRPGLAATSCSIQRTTTRYAGATTRESATRLLLASAPMAKPFTSATSGSPTTTLAPSITGGASTIGDKPAPLDQQGEGPVCHPAGERCRGRRPAHTGSRSTSSAQSAGSATASTQRSSSSTSLPSVSLRRTQLGWGFPAKTAPPRGSEAGSVGQRPCTKALRGFVLSLCDGLGAALEAWRDMPCDIVSAASENDPHCIAVTAHRHQAATQLVDMRAIEASVLRKLLGSASFDFFLLAAGTPHMQLSRLASDKSGLEGRDSSLFWEFVRIKGLLKDIARDMSVRFFFLLENVVPTNVKDLKDMEVALDVAAVEVDSAQMGWHRRPRVWFANFALPRCLHKFLDTRGKQTTLAIPAAARRLGPMGPIFRGRFFPRYLRESGTKQFPEGRFPCLTCPLRPGMIPRGLDRVEPSVRERCLQDDWIYPAWHFERSALTWAGDCWQRPTPEQWEELFHLPRAYTFEGLPDCPKQRELARLRMLGNTWDVKVVRCFYYGLLESIGQPIPASFFDTVADIDADLTIADPYEELWGKTQQDFVDTYLRYIPEPLASLAWPFRHLLDPPDENPFLAWAAKQGLYSGGLYFPSLQEFSRHGASAAQADRQTGFHASRHGWPRVVPWGFSAENHFLFSKQFSDHPYDMEIDLPTGAGLRHALVPLYRHCARSQVRHHPKATSSSRQTPGPRRGRSRVHVREDPARGRAAPRWFPPLLVRLLRVAGHNPMRAPRHWLRHPWPYRVPAHLPPFAPSFSTYRS